MKTVARAARRLMAARLALEKHPDDPLLLQRVTQGERALERAQQSAYKRRAQVSLIPFLPNDVSSPWTRRESLDELQRDLQERLRARWSLRTTRLNRRIIRELLKSLRAVQSVQNKSPTQLQKDTRGLTY